MKIIVVEDNDISLLLIQKTLEAMGHETSCFTNAADALKEWQKGFHHVVISDWMMPGMDGLQLCTALRQTPTHVYTYFILLTANVGDDKYNHAMDVGVDDFLTKPLNRMELKNRLKVAERVVNFSSDAAKLKEIVTVCMYTGKVKDDDQNWISMEQFITHKLGTRFSHGISPEAMDTIVKPMLKELDHPHKNPT